MHSKLEKKHRGHYSCYKTVYNGVRIYAVQAGISKYTFLNSSHLQSSQSTKPITLQTDRRVRRSTTEKILTMKNDTRVSWLCELDITTDGLVSVCQFVYVCVRKFHLECM